MTSFLRIDKKLFLNVFAALLGAALVLAWRLSCPPAVPAYNNHNLINPNLIRLHVIANSDSPADQALKYQVRDAVVGAMAEKFGGVENAAQARMIARENLGYIQQLAVEKIRAAGKDYPVTVEMGDFPFPAKTYHTSLYNFTLPAGNYEAVRVILGQGGGANWWCVLFPPLCFVDPGSVAPAAENAAPPGIEKKAGEKSGGACDKQEDREKREQIQLARPFRENGALGGVKSRIKEDERGQAGEDTGTITGKAAGDCTVQAGAQSGPDAFSASGGARPPAVPAFKLTAPEALVALGSLQKDENAWTLTAGGERVEFRFKLLDFFHQSGSWFKRLLGEDEAQSKA